MTSGPADRSVFLWSGAQSHAVLLLVLAFVAALIVCRARDGTEVADPPTGPGRRASELADRVDPNVADWQTLAAIPTLGPKRGHEIVGYRESRRALDPALIPFRTTDDLLAVRGVGVSTVTTIERFLTFPQTQRVTVKPAPSKGK